MRTWMMAVVAGLVALSAQAEEHQRPRVALLPLDLPAAKLSGEQKELDDFWVGLWSRRSVQLAGPDAVRAELQRKYQGACPDTALVECLAWMAEHTSSGYALSVALRKLSPRMWELAATIVARNGAEVPRPAARRFTFAESPDLTLKEAVKRELDAYSNTLGLEALPLNPPAPGARPADAPVAQALLAPVAVPPGSLDVKSTPPVVEPRTPSGWRWGYVALGAGALAAGVGAYFGNATLATAAQASSGAPAQYGETVRKAKGQAAAATAAFVTGGVLGSVGGVMLGFEL